MSARPSAKERTECTGLTTTALRLIKVTNPCAPTGPILQCAAAAATAAAATANAADAAADVQTQCGYPTATPGTVEKPSKEAPLYDRNGVMTAGSSTRPLLSST
jgi:hypothetical protein